MRSCIRFISILIGSTLLFSACGKRKSTQGAAKPLESFSAIYAARLVDIPVPLQSKSLERYFYAQDGISTLGYDVRGYLRDYMLFYEQGLERSGWQKGAVSVTPFETVLIYDKPERFCLISFRYAHQDGSIPIRIIIHTGAKETSAYAS